MFAAFFRFFSVFSMFAVFRLLPPQGGESVAPYQAFGAHPLMQITETLHIKHYSKSLYTNITPFFPTLQADPSDSANDTKTAPASCYRNRGGSLALFVLFQALMQNLAGILDRSLGGCQNYRVFGFTIFRYLKSFQLTFTTFCLFSPSWGHKRYLQYFHWFNTVPIIPAFKQSLDSDHAAMLVSRYNLLPTEC